jgi:hypothetical protein
MAIKEREIPQKTKDPFEEYKKRKPIDKKEIVNGQLKTTLFFDEEKLLSCNRPAGKDEYWRHVTGIVVEDGNSNLDLCSLAPEDTCFETYSAYSYSGGLIALRQGLDTPTAETMIRDGTTIVIFNPEILELPGGNLILLHEVGHAWQISNGLFEKMSKARVLLCKYSLKSKTTKEDLLAAAALLNSGENDAWRFALAKYQEIKNRGLDLTPRLAEEELREYPQAIYDGSYNVEIWQALEVIGQSKKLRWRPK